MREGWEVKLLKDICSVFGRIGFRGYTKADFVSTPENGAITLSPSNIIGGELSCDKCSYVSWEKYYQSPEIMIFPGDILLVKTASIGKCALVRSLPHEATINPQFVVLKEIKVNHQYLTYFLQSPIAQKKFQEFAIGAAVPTFSQKKLEGLVVPTPSLPEQQRIVDILDREFAKIDVLKANAEKSLHAAKDLFQATLKKELELKEGWKTMKMGDVSLIARGGSPRPIKSFITKDADGVNWIKIGDTEVGGKYIYSTKEKIRKEGMRSSRYVEAGDFLLSNSMSFGRPYILKTDGCIHDGWLVIKKYEKTFTQDFLYYLLLSPVVVRQFEEGARGSTVRNLNTDIVSAVVVSCPASLDEQQEIVRRVEEQNYKCKALQENYQKTLALCDDLKQALLRKAFNGEL